MKDKKTRLNYWQIASIALGAVAIVAVLGTAAAVKADTGGFWDNVAGKLAQILSGKVEDPGSSIAFGGSTSDNWNVGGNLTVAGTASVTGALTASGAVAGLYPLVNIDAPTAIVTTTLTNALSGTTYRISNASGTAFVLPATSTSAGVYFRFVIGGAIATNVTIVTSNGGDDIEGTLIVAGAVVDCSAEDTLTFVADGENIGDYVEVYSDGTHWLIGDSGALTGSKLTCTAT